MPRIWLPIKEETSQRQTILYIPGASRIDASKLRELIAKGTEEARAEMKAQGPQPKAKVSKAEIAAGLRDFRRHLDRAKANGGRPRYH